MRRSLFTLCIILLLSLTAVLAASAEDAAAVYETTCISCGAAVTGQYDLYSHHYSCTSCGRVYSATHQNYCSDLTSCADCGATGIVIKPENLYQQHHENLVCSFVDAESCQYGCTVCGFKYGEQNHYLYCSSPDACSTCGAEAALLDVELSHTFYGQPWVSMGDFHQQTCRNCDAFRTGEHYGDCTDPDYCTVCDTDGVVINEDLLSHDMDYVNLGLTHQRTCKDCGLKEPAEAHDVDCAKPGYCRSCNAEDVSVPQNAMSHGVSVIVSRGDTYHEELCTLCGYVYSTQEHWAYCAEQTTCVDCGATDLSLLPRQIVHNQYRVENLGNTHRPVCSDCGLIGAESPHTVYCTAPTVCKECDAKDLTMAENQLKHRSTHYEKLDELYHQNVCEDCGNRTPASRNEAGYYYQHQTNCFDETQTCLICDAPNVQIPQFDQDHTMQYIDLGELHQSVCTMCDYKLSPSRHSAACTDPTVCALCGLTGLQVAEEDIDHDFNSLTFVSTGDRHQMVCMKCGWRNSPAPHTINCDDSTSCTTCGQTGLNLPLDELIVWHVTPRNLVENLGTEHRYRCVCGENVTTEPHEVECTAPTICRICGADDVVMPPEMMKHGGHSENLGYQHQYFCDYCDYSEPPEDHTVYCHIPDQCNDCFAVLLDYPAERMTHAKNFLSYEDAGDQHRIACSGCGKSELENHDYTHNIMWGECICGHQLDNLPGDVNSSGEVDTADVLRYLLWIEDGEDVNGKYPINWNNADVNSDSRRDEADVLRILQYLSGWDVTLE